MKAWRVAVGLGALMLAASVGAMAQTTTTPEKTLAPVVVKERGKARRANLKYLRDRLGDAPCPAIARDDMAAVDTLIRNRLASDVVLINQIADYIVSGTEAGTVASGSDNGYNGEYAGFTRLTSGNAGTATIRGWEFTYQQQFTFDRRAFLHRQRLVHHMAIHRS